MFSSVRQFAIVSLVILLPITIGTAIYLRAAIEKEIILTIAEDNNESIVSGFSKAVWQRYAKSLRLLPCKREPCPDTTAFYQALGRDIENYFKDLPLLQYGVYHPGGEKVITGEQFSQGTGADRESNTAFLSAQYGTARSTLEMGLNVGGEEHNVVRSFVPIYAVDSGEAGNPRVEGVVELVYNISPMWKNPLFYQMMGIGFFGCMFITLFGMVLIISKKSENIITSQHEMNLDLSTAKASAEAENQEKSKFLANVSHELRTPLNAIIGFSEILKDEVLGPIGNEQYKDYVGDIHNSGVHLLSLINDILDFSKANAGKLEVDMSEVDVTKIMKACIRLVSPRAKEAGVALMEEMPEEHFVIKTDAKRIKQVLLNLLSNSVKFTPANGTITLASWSSVAEGKLVIEVKDTGVGIAAKDISKVMATFGQVENELSRKYEGTGLGLPLSKKLVELMGGTFDIKSQVGKGTVITITLPN